MGWAKSYETSEIRRYKMELHCLDVALLRGAHGDDSAKIFKRLVVSKLKAKFVKIPAKYQTTTSSPQHAHLGPMALPKSNRQPDPKPLHLLVLRQKIPEK